MIFNKRIYVSTEGGLGNQIFMWLNAKNFANANNSIIFFETLSGYIFGLNNPYNKKFKRYTKLKQFKNIKNNQSNLFISLIFIIIRIFNYFFKIKKVSSINLIFFRITVFNDFIFAKRVKFPVKIKVSKYVLISNDVLFVNRSIVNTSRNGFL